ncbi:hypothetical protein [Marinobacter sp.]|uniref:hypothetical protein n=1 Tax=Marinobacter sp. TaxID=50741 RepID=UPI0026293126|nr:hypothetical protein [Marinobacter sp.]
MHIYPDENVQPGSAAGFEIDNIYLSPRTVARILKGINGVTRIKTRRLFSKWEDTHVWFTYLDHECVVIEPFGDNSHYWVGPKNVGTNVDFTRVEDAFRKYQPPLPVKVFGDLLTLNFKSLFKGHRNT